MMSLSGTRRSLQFRMAGRRTRSCLYLDSNPLLSAGTLRPPTSAAFYGVMSGGHFNPIMSLVDGAFRGVGEWH